MQIPIPINEAQRVSALQSYQILDTVPEASYDDITLLASQICGTPIAAVSLIDSDRQWFKSKLGLDVSETAREHAFCAHAILSPDLTVVQNAEDDQRFASNPLVTGAPWIRFYAGAPLTTPSGETLGTLCVIDRVERTLSETEANALRALSRQVMAQLELRRHIELQKQHRLHLEEMQQKLEQTNRQLQTESLTDDVTGFHNTRFLHGYLDSYLKRENAHQGKLSLVFFDMDGFKAVVDTHGHQLGARVLKEVAIVVHRDLDPSARIVRYGGDEFVVILPNQNREKAMATTEKMRKAIRTAVFLAEGNHHVQVTASFGLAVFPEDAKNRKELLLAADQCLFQSKRSGKDRISTRRATLTKSGQPFRRGHL